VKIKSTTIGFISKAPGITHSSIQLVEGKVTSEVPYIHDARLVDSKRLDREKEMTNNEMPIACNPNSIQD
jgi:hypothetical protein